MKTSVRTIVVLVLWAALLLLAPINADISSKKIIHNYVERFGRTPIEQRQMSSVYLIQEFRGGAVPNKKSILKRLIHFFQRFIPNKKAKKNYSAVGEQKKKKTTKKSKISHGKISSVKNARLSRVSALQPQ
jgi:hypothetical protein